MTTDFNADPPILECSIGINLSIGGCLSAAQTNFSDSSLDNSPPVSGPPHRLKNSGSLRRDGPRSPASRISSVSSSGTTCSKAMMARENESSNALSGASQKTQNLNDLMLHFDLVITAKSALKMFWPPMLFRPSGVSRQSSYGCMAQPISTRSRVGEYKASRYLGNSPPAAQRIGMSLRNVKFLDIIWAVGRCDA
ncbi:hypothetical protein CPB85DRAFT_1328435 [Mucidula mucida]|nr:hypothetical protein CPB85DRAFT_1328435 [Mucidula mucida]